MTKPLTELTDVEFFDECAKAVVFMTNVVRDTTSGSAWFIKQNQNTTTSANLARAQLHGSMPAVLNALGDLCSNFEMMADDAKQDEWVSKVIAESNRRKVQRDGGAGSCGNCGICCMEMGLPPFIDGDGCLEKLPEYVRVDYELGVEARKATNYQPECVPCDWLDQHTKTCRHYRYRPEICREFEVGGEDCERLRGRM